jgi:Zn-dependent peptidase ImmA (M78 family)/DNA-binding XRE family transcriptional regulator
MRVGTPGFVPQRLRRAREARTLTVQSLAEMLGVSRQSLTAYESGAQTPGPAVLAKLSAVLGLPERHFVTPLPDFLPMELLYRSMAAATAKSRKKSERRFDWLREILEYVEELVEFPAMDIPDFGISDPLRLSDADIETLANAARAHWNLGNGPIGNMVALLESRGIVVSRFALDSDHLDSFCAHAADIPAYVVLNAEKSFAARLRIDAAHEFGHIVLHRGHRFSVTDHVQVEQQAFRFGAAFLFPEVSFRREVLDTSLPSLTAHKKRWNFSIKAMIQRAIQLDLIDDERATRLWKYYSSRKFHHEEPYDRETPIEQPRLLLHAFEMIVNEGLATKQQILDALPFTAREIEELASLPEGFFPADLAPVIDLKPRETQRQLFETAGEGTVLRFPPSPKGTGE